MQRFLLKRAKRVGEAEGERRWWNRQASDDKGREGTRPSKSSSIISFGAGGREGDEEMSSSAMKSFSTVVCGWGTAKGGKPGDTERIGVSFSLRELART